MTSEDREHAKRIVYSVVYGAGKYHTHTHTHGHRAVGGIN